MRLCSTEMRDDDRIICCSASSWTVAIAWLQMLGSVALAWMSVLALLKDSRRSSHDTIIRAWIVLVGSIVGLIMGFVLLIGAKQRNRNYLTAWSISAISGLLAVIIFTLVMLNRIGSEAYQDLLATPILGFKIWVVEVFKDQIKTEEKHRDYTLIS